MKVFVKWLEIIRLIYACYFFFNFQSDTDNKMTQLIDQMTLLLSKHQYANGVNTGDEVMAKKVATLEDELSHLTQRRIEHLEKLQQQQFQLQVKLFCE